MSVALVRRCSLLLVLLVLAPAASRADTAAPVRYDVSVASVEGRRFRVSVTVTPDGSGPVLFAIPAWAPGYYQIMSFAQDISAFRAADGAGRSLRTMKLDANTWQVSGARGPVTATYEVGAHEAGFGFFGSHLDDETGFINGASAFMYVVGGKQRPAVLNVHTPEGWRAACPLDSDGVATYKAADYDELIDCPVQMGHFERQDFTVNGVPFSMLIVGQTGVDRNALVKMLTSVSAAGMRVFGGAPFRRYFYIFHCGTGGFSGGLEHRSSTVLNVWSIPGADPRPWLTLASHEYFHAWNVKRIRPAVLGPFDYTQKVRTGALWFAEGVTDYYSLVLPRMAGLMTTDEFLGDIARRVSRLQKNAARTRVSVEEASRKAWEGASMGYGGLSYYEKGSLLGFLFDIEIRAATDDRKGLDDVMRALDREYGQRNVGYDEDAILRAINEVSGQDFTDQYNHWVRSTDEIPWNDVLRLAGLRFRTEAEKVAYLGVAAAPTRRGTVSVDDVTRGEAADEAGIKVGDEIVTVNGVRRPWATWNAAIRRLRPGQRVTFGVRRGGQAMDITVTMGSRTETEPRLVETETADDRAKHVYAGLTRESGQQAAANAPVAGR